jgi:hypothetical protein
MGWAVTIFNLTGTSIASDTAQVLPAGAMKCRLAITDKALIQRCFSDRYRIGPEKRCCREQFRYWRQIAKALVETTLGSLRQFLQSIPALYHNLAGRLDGRLESGVICRDLRWLTPHESSLPVWQQFEFDFISRSDAKVLQKVFRQCDPPPRSDCQCPHANDPLSTSTDLRYCNFHGSPIFDRKGSQLELRIGLLSWF